MKIHFGLHLDGQHGRQPRNLLGEITVGPKGLLNILETQLGLLSVPVSITKRIAQFRHCLVQLDSEKRFYHRSFEIDPMGTAAYLLDWRDQWIMHGWNGTIAAEASARLLDMQALEPLVREQLSPSEGERLTLVAKALQAGCPPIWKIILHDVIEAFPKRWRDVLSLLPTKAETEQERNMAQGSGFLGKLQSALAGLTPDEKSKKLPFENDGTVQVVRAETGFVAGRWLAGMFNNEAQTLIVASAKGGRLDSLLASSGRARQGLGENSPFRPALQMLPLALAVLWNPLDVYALMQFLTHPVCPVPAHARRRLAEKLADFPGIGGKEWEGALADIEKECNKRGEDGPAVREKISFWVEHERYSPAGASIEVVLDRLRRLQSHINIQINVGKDLAEQASFGAAKGQCQALAEVLQVMLEQGNPTVDRRQLEQLVEQVTGSGSDNPLWQAEVGGSLHVTHPAAAIETYDRVIWWQMGMPSLPSNYPWSKAEQITLKGAGVDLPDVGQLLEQSARDWLRPILAATKSLVLILPPEGHEAHPLWQMIEELIKGLPVESLEENVFAKAGLGTIALEHKPLPQRRRWWQLPISTPMPRKPTDTADSHSRLDLFLFNPFQWLLKYPASLKPSRILAVSDSFLLYGKLTHGLIERFYLVKSINALQMDEATFAQWFALHFERIIAEEGAVLLLPGRGAELERFRGEVFRAMQELRLQLASANVTAVEPEMELEGEYVGGKIRGFADLVLTHGDSKRSIIDMKWSGGKKYPAMLEKNSAVQLAIYSKLLREKEGNGTWPPIAYFLLAQARLYAPDDLTYPKAAVKSPKNEGNLAQLWMKLETSWKWRQQQLDARIIEVALESMKDMADENSKPPEGALDPEYLKETYNDYLALAGWKQ